ncbi:MAG: YlxR family protein [Micrococcus sp.]|nr:YlxR family protein [Micrococcus sp.]
MRTCVGCRRGADQQELERVVLDLSTEPPTVQWDPERRRQGRGAWVHRDPACVERAVQRRGFQRSFRRALDTSRLGTDAAGSSSGVIPATHRAAAPAEDTTDEGGSEI